MRGRRGRAGHNCKACSRDKCKTQSEIQSARGMHRRVERRVDPRKPGTYFTLGLPIIITLPTNGGMARFVSREPAVYVVPP